MREEHGEPDVIEIRRTFLSKRDAQDWEDKVLKRLGAVNHRKWLNLCRGGKEFNNNGGYALSSKTKEKMKGRVISEENKHKNSIRLKGKMRYTDQNGVFQGWFLKDDPQITKQNLIPQKSNLSEEQRRITVDKATAAKLGSHTYNDGTREIKRKEHPGEGWTLGRLSRTEEHQQKQTEALRKVRSGKICYNDGYRNFYILPSETPKETWIRGMKPRSKHSEP